MLSRRADAERDRGGVRHGRCLLKIAMLSPTSKLPRTTDVGGGITGGSTEYRRALMPISAQQSEWRC